MHVKIPQQFPEEFLRSFPSERENRESEQFSVRERENHFFFSNILKVDGEM